MRALALRRPRLAAARRVRAALAGVVLMAASGTAPAQPRMAGELELKAAFIYRIAMFVEWPSDTAGGGAPFQICVLGADTGWSAALATIEGKKVQGRTVMPPRLLARGDEARACQVAVLADGDVRRAAALPAAVLTVGDAAGFAQAGGIVGFVREGTQLRFDINRDAATHAQLRLPAELLKVARAVIDNGSGR